MHKKAGFAALAISVLLASCMVGPKYSKPQAPSAPAYSQQPPASFENTPGWKTAQPSDAMNRGKWWEIFGNSDLNALEEQVGPANQSLKVAEANYRQARSEIQFNRSNLFPTISAGALITHNRTSTNNPTGLPGREYAN